MSLYSEGFILCLPVVWLCWAVVARSHRWIVLLAASLAFYGMLVGPYVYSALALVTIGSYATAIAMAGPLRQRPMFRKATFWTAVVGILGVLVWSRYLPFVAGEVNAGLLSVGSVVSVPIPGVLVAVGVSFHVFTAISYLSDVYLERSEPERHLGLFALYLYYFPKLVQGPIERASSVIPQLAAARRPSGDELMRAIALLLLGLLKKLVVADRLRIMVDGVYGGVSAFAGWPLAVATVAYALQIYFDFSGYTDMARGISRAFGIELSPNFDRPYLASSVPEFWRRWHISLSSWIGDYLFRPLQMRFRHRGDLGNALALILAFALCGLWHGPGWGFLLWGGLHGLYMASSALLRRRQRALYKRLGIERSRIKGYVHSVATFGLVCFAWIFFRASSLADAWYVVTHIAIPRSGELSDLLAPSWLALSVGMALALLMLERKYPEGESLASVIVRGPGLARWGLLYALALIVFLLGAAGPSGTTFIYAQF